MIGEYPVERIIGARDGAHCNGHAAQYIELLHRFRAAVDFFIIVPSGEIGDRAVDHG